MAFKSVAQYQEDKNGDFFVLPNDGDYADVIFLYKSKDDVLVGDVHYLNTATYKGYAHCCGAGTGCPACTYGEKGIPIQHKIFIPLCNLTKNRKIEFWDRTTFFEQVLETAIFKNYPDPSMCVFRITRHGAAGSRDTKYDIRAIGRNASMPYEKILADNNLSFPDGYSKICREMTAEEMSAALNSTASMSSLQDYGYTPVPRGAAPEAPQLNVPTTVYSEPPTSLPPVADVAPAPSAVADMPEYNPANIPISGTGTGTEDSDAGSGDDLDDVAF